MSDKRFHLRTKNDCCVFLWKILFSCTGRMDSLKRYNQEIESILSQYKGKEKIPYRLYTEMVDKMFYNICYLLNLIGDCESASISYCYYRKFLEHHKIPGVQLLEITPEMDGLLAEFTKMRNWQNHVPQSLLLGYMQLVNEGKRSLNLDEVSVPIRQYVTYEYFQNLQKQGIAFYANARKIIQFIKRDYSLLMGKSITYSHFIVTEPIGLEQNEATHISGTIQKLHGLKIEP